LSRHIVSILIEEITILAADTVVHVRIDGQVKEEATQVLSEMGLSVADALWLLPVRVATEKVFLFDVKIPNTVTLKAMNEAVNGGGTSYSSVDELMADLNADN